MIKRCIYCQSRSNVAESDIDCPKCGLTNKLTPFLDTPMMNATTFRVFDAFESPASGKVITSHRDRERDMKESNCRDWEGIDQEKKEAERRKQYDQAKFDSQIESAMTEEMSKLTQEQRESLTSL